MKRILLFSPFFLLILLFAHSCKSKLASTETTTEIPDESEVIVEEQVADSINFIQIYIDSIQIGRENRILGESIHAEIALPEFYAKQNYQLVFKDEYIKSEAIIALITSWKEGLNPKDYHLESILKLHSYLEDHPEDQKKKAVFDILLSDGLIVYAYQLYKGKLDPESLYPTWNFFSRTLPENSIDQLIIAINENKIESFLVKLPPQTRDYQGMRSGILKYNNIISMGSWESLPEISNSIKPYENSYLMPLLRDRLSLEGFDIASDSSFYYDENLLTQVKLFQATSGLEPDGVIGKNTIKALNESADSKLNKLRVNMERSRWVEGDEMEEFFIVNIAKYQLYYSDSGKVTYSSKVMVGTDEKQTPVFRDKMEYIVFNPTWTLPQSIASKETLPKLKQDSLYLKKNNMHIINSKGEILSDSGIVWSNYTSDYFPFIIRQEPGPGNALGRVKFLFPNNYAIYLHDTPSKSLFAKEERAFSHGCIRVQNPLDLAEFILQKQDANWTMDSIKTIIADKETHTVRLKKSIPIYIMYWTAGVDEYDRLFFVPDVYGRDERILKALGN